MFGWFKRNKKSENVTLPETDELLIVALNKNHVPALKSFTNTQEGMAEFIQRMQPNIITLLYEEVVCNHLPNLAAYNQYLSKTAIARTPVPNTMCVQGHLSTVSANSKVSALYCYQILHTDRPNYVNRVMVVFDEKFLGSPPLNPLTQHPNQQIHTALDHLCLTYGLRWLYTYKTSGSRVIAMLLPLHPEFTLASHCEFTRTLSESLTDLKTR